MRSLLLSTIALGLFAAFLPDLKRKI